MCRCKTSIELRIPISKNFLFPTSPVNYTTATAHTASNSGVYTETASVYTGDLIGVFLVLGIPNISLGNGAGIH